MEQLSPTHERLLAHTFILYIPLEINKNLGSQTSISYPRLHVKLLAMGVLQCVCVFSHPFIKVTCAHRTDQRKGTQSLPPRLSSHPQDNHC